MGAFFVPAGLVVLVTWIYFLCTIFRLRRRSSESTKELAASSVSSPPPPPPESQPALGGSASLHSTDSGVHAGLPPVEDQYSLKVQFLALVTTHFLFLALWCCGAMAMWQTGRESLLFSCLYAVAVTALGLFLVVHHCLRRLDVQAAWLGCCPAYRRSQPMRAYTHSCAAGPGNQSASERGSQLYVGCVPPGEANNCSSARSSSTPSGTSSVGPGPGPCKLTNLLQVTQENGNNTARVPTTVANTNTSPAQSTTSQHI